MVSTIFSNSHKYIYFWKYFKKNYTIFYIYVYFNNRICGFNVISLLFYTFIEHMKENLTLFIYEQVIS
jgi:hypothetical protein